MIPKVGDIVRHDRIQGRNLTEPMWSHIYRVVGDRTRAWVLVKGSAGWAAPDISGQWPPTSSQVAKCIIPEDEVPDEVWAEIARRALLGESV